MLYDFRVAPSVFDAIREGRRVVIPAGLPYEDVFLEDEICFKEDDLNRGLTGNFVIVKINSVGYTLDPEFPIELGWKAPQKAK